MTFVPGAPATSAATGARRSPESPHNEHTSPCGAAASALQHAPRSGGRSPRAVQFCSSPPQVRLFCGTSDAEESCEPPREGSCPAPPPPPPQFGGHPSPQPSAQPGSSAHMLPAPPGSDPASPQLYSSSSWPASMAWTVDVGGTDAAGTPTAPLPPAQQLLRELHHQQHAQHQQQQLLAQQHQHQQLWREHQRQLLLQQQHLPPGLRQPLDVCGRSVSITVSSPRVELSGCQGNSSSSTASQLPRAAAGTQTDGQPMARKRERQATWQQQQLDRAACRPMPRPQSAAHSEGEDPHADFWDTQALEELAAAASASASDAQPPRARQQPFGRDGEPRALRADGALPARLAAQQLGRVQQALLHSQRLFERQAAVVEQAVAARAFYAWRHLQAAQEQRRAAALAACRRVAMGRLRRCLHSWRRLCGQHEERQQALAHVQALLRRALLRRCWREWRRVAGLRWWKVQLEQRDANIHRLSVQVRRLESRPVRLMQRRRLRLWLAAWQQEAWVQRAKRVEWAALAQRARRLDVLRAFAGWQAVAAEKAAQQRAQQRADRLLARLRLRHTLLAWRDALCSVAVRRAAEAAAQQLQRQLLQQRALHGWRYLTWFYDTAAHAQAAWQRKSAAVVLGAWRRHAVLAAARRALLAELAAARASQRAAIAFSAWLAAVEGRQARRRAEELARVGEEAERLAAENASLRQEAERLSRVIDSGDWGRQRVQELLQAGRVLQQERDALAVLLAGLQQGGGGGGSGSSAGVGPLVDATNSPTTAQPLVVAAGGALQQRYGLQACDGGAGAGSPRLASRAVSPDARNRLLVRGGSSFNAMVRALKQDLVASGTLQRGGPAALYEVDKLSLNRVSVAADGGVTVEAVSSPDRHGVAFGRSQPGSPVRARGSAGAKEEAACRSSGGGGLLAAALRLQGLGGRSVAVGVPGGRARTPK